MGRNKGTFNFSANLEVRTAAPLDPRLVVDSASDLVLASTWDGGDSKAWLYDGMVVSIRDSHKLVMLTNYNPETAADAYKTASNWVEVNASAASVNVIDNLTSESTTDPLSAKQGKVLKTEIDTLKANLGSALNYKGSKDAYADLPTDASNGDVYNVVAANGNIPAGTNYVWNGTEWDPLGGTVDLSGYATKTELNSQKDAYEAADLALGSRIDALSSTVNSNNDTINSQLEAIKVKDLGTSSSGLVGLALDADGKLTVSDSISGVSVKVGSNTTIPDVNAETSIKDALEEVYDAVAGGITGVNAGAGIEVTGDANTKTVKVKIADGSALKIDENNALSLVWEEIE